MKKLSVLMFLLAVLFPSFVHAQTSHGRVQSCRIDRYHSLHGETSDGRDRC
jgi:hypothetical protein